MNRNEDLKKKILDELSTETEKDIIVRSILKEEHEDILGEEFTRSVVKAAKATKKTSPVIRLTRVALPFAACAAAVLIFVSVGLKDNVNSSLPKDFDTVKIEGDMVIAEDPYKSNSDDFDMAPDDKVPATSDTSFEETENNAESNNVPSSSASSSPKENDEQTHTEDSEKVYTLNLASSQMGTTTFTPSDNAKKTTGEITVKVSDTYYGKAIFGYTVYLSVEGKEYEVIVTSEKEISKSELLNQINSYTTSLCDLMNKAENTDKWQIEIVSEELPSTIEPNTRIKITRTK